MRVTIICACAALGLVVAGCGSKGSTYQAKPKEQPKPVDAKALTPDNAFPAKVGNQWVYSVTLSGQLANGQSYNGTQDIVWRVAKVEPISDGKRITFEIRESNKVTSRQIWEATSKGLYQREIGIGTKGGHLVFSPSLPAIVFPATTDREFTWKGMGPVPPQNKAGMTTSKSKILPAIVVDTAKTRMSAVPVETKNQYAGGGSSITTVYFVPDIGMVRYMGQTSTSKVRGVTKIVLKSFRAAK